MMTTNKTHWPSLIILVTFGICSAVLFLLFIGLMMGSIMTLFKADGDPAGKMIVAVAYGLESLMLLICSWVVLQRVMGREQAFASIKLPYSEWQIVVFLGIILLSVSTGAVVSYIQVQWLAWFILPVATILVIVPPIWLILGVGTKGIPLGKRWQVFTILGMSMTIGPLIMIALELAALLGIILGGGVLITLLKPDLARELIGMGKIISDESNPEMILNLVGPYLKSRLVIGTLIGYIAVIVPLIEELFKPLAVWIFARKLSSPAQGFALGMLSGAAFAIFESMNASGNGSMSWAVIVSVRAGTSLLHTTASGLVGWGITAAFAEKRPWRFFSAYLTAAGIHGIWNACAAGISIASLGQSIGKPEWLFNFIPALLCGMLVLGIGMLAVLIISNRKLRSSLNADHDLEIRNESRPDGNENQPAPFWDEEVK
jgi:PrsW family intramembrane metalloprotease